MEDNKFPFIVLANKTDIDPQDRLVSEDDAKQWCSNNGGHTYIETSAKNAKNVDYCFETAVRSVTRASKGEVSISNLTSGTPSIDLRAMTRQKKSDGCC